MKLKLDEERYDRLQIDLIEEIKNSISRQLHSAGLKSDALREATDNVAFMVAAILDSSQIMESDGKPMRPYLTFEDPDTEETLIHAGSNSWMHEYALSGD